jgi:3-oxoacyl-[acyl-carrier protein] reductase
MPTVLITGAASGIGLATARRLAPKMRVILADVDESAAETAAKSLREHGHQADAIGVDVRSAASVQRMVQTIDADIGEIDALFSNAGISSHEPVASISEAEWDSVIETHVKGGFLVTQAVLPQMVERRAGSIVIMSSDYAVKGMRNGAAYAAAKTALYSLCKTLAGEFAPFGIRVNAVGPGPIDTPLLRRGRSPAQWEDHKQARVQSVPMKRLGQPEEVAALVDFLLGPRSSYITGQLIHPNGGQISW